MKRGTGSKRNVRPLDVNILCSPPQQSAIGLPDSNENTGFPSAASVPILGTTIGPDESWKDFRFETNDDDCDPEMIARHVKETIRRNNLPVEETKQERRKPRSSMEVAEENLRKKAELVEQAAKAKEEEKRLMEDCSEEIRIVGLSKQSVELYKNLDGDEKKILQQLPQFVPPLPCPLPYAPYWSHRLVNDVIIDAVFTPGEFYIRNYESRHDLQYLEKSLLEYYDPYWKVCTLMTKEEVVIGGFYAVYHYDTSKWYRGVVEAPIHRGEDATASFEMVAILVDHGDYIIINLECIFPLREIFTHLPIQVARANFSVPYILDMTWTKAEAELLQNDIKGKTMRAFIRKQGTSGFTHMAFVDVVLFEVVNGKERVYNMQGRLEAGLRPKV